VRAQCVNATKRFVSANVIRDRLLPFGKTINDSTPKAVAAKQSNSYLDR